jgi:hypothetical protein
LLAVLLGVLALQVLVLAAVAVLAGTEQTYQDNLQVAVAAQKERMQLQQAKILR